MSVGPGTRLGPYELIAPIGEGGMGQVWRARHTALKRDDALKLLLPSRPTLNGSLDSNGKRKSSHPQITPTSLTVYPDRLSFRGPP